jgi:hypothetical protein
MTDEEAALYHEDPEHCTPAGPWVVRRVRLGVRDLRYDPPSCGPATQTVSAGSLPYWQRNPDL